jgi:hypothetical protein
MYAVPFSAVAATLAQDPWELLAGTDHPIALHSLVITQSSDTDSEQLRVTIKRVTGSPTSGSGGSSVTPVPLDPTDTAAAFTAEVNNTTRISGGTQTTIHDECFNVLSGWSFDPTTIPDMRPKALPGTRLVVGLEGSPADSLTISGVAYVEEF